MRAILCRILFLLSLVLVVSPIASAVDGITAPPKLLLTPQRLRRLQRDRERQTVRWGDFENRVQSAPDSSQRGFELALYFAVTHDEQRGREAVQWALAHSCDRRQVALILDWCRPLIAAADYQKLMAAHCDVPPTAIRQFRDNAFWQIAQEQDLTQPNPDSLKQAMEGFRAGGFKNPEELYALCEYIDAVRNALRVDLRQDFSDFFVHLPAEVLLAMKPEELANPQWQVLAASLILVTLDPNLPDSQFLQGWAIEDKQMMREGEGVVYEFLWGNPYLPGVSYQNLDPWFYDQRGHFFARTDWSPNACWVAIAPNGVQDHQCPADWRQKTTSFGHLSLVPMLSTCVEPPRPATNESVILWAKPKQKITYREGGHQDKPLSREADASGLLQRPMTAEGKFCVSLRP